MKRTWITVKRGILEPKHRFRLGELIWLFMYILDITNWEEGVIEEWLDRGAAEDMEMPLATLRDQRIKLEKLGYITSERKQHGIRLLVHNWTNPKEYTGQKYNVKVPSHTLDTTPSHTLDIIDRHKVEHSTSSQKSQIKNQKKDSEFSETEPITSPFDEITFNANKEWEFIKSQVLRQTQQGSNGYHIIKGLEFSRVENNNMVISAKDETTKLWVEDRIIKVMQKLVKAEGMKIVVEVKE